MDTSRARDLYYKYRAAVAYVAVRTPRGDERIGTAFHVGDNFWVTAWHVVEGNEILEVATTGWSISNYTDTVHDNRGELRGEWLTNYGRYGSRGSSRRRRKSTRSTTGATSVTHISSCLRRCVEASAALRR